MIDELPEIGEAGGNVVVLAFRLVLVLHRTREHEQPVVIDDEWREVGEHLRELARVAGGHPGLCRIVRVAALRRLHGLSRQAARQLAVLRVEAGGDVVGSWHVLKWHAKIPRSSAGINSGSARAGRMN